MKVLFSKLLEANILKLKKHRYRFSYTQLIAISFIVVVLIGAFLLSLPISSRTHEWTPFVDSLFTSTSAACVTGLAVYDTYTHWSLFGQIVLLILVQIGGLGFMTIMCFFAIVTKHHMSLYQRRLVMQAAGHVQLSGVITLVRKILIGTFLFEGIGTVLLAIRFCPMMGFWEGLYNGIFHSVMAFCNAGFDLMGKYKMYSSLMLFQSDVLVQTVIMALISIGGIGFFVWSDVLRWGIHFKKYALHTKMVLSMTLFLILSGAVGFFFLEYHESLAGLSLGDKILASFFQSVTTRTAGFNTIDQTAMRGGAVLSVVWILIGGSPGSTAGGIKTTTVLVAILITLATIRGKKSATIFKKRISDETVRQAFTIITIYIVLVFVATALLMVWEPITFSEAIFEVSSAVGTAGLTMDITPTLGSASKILLSLLIYVGRVGGYSFILVFATEKANPDMERPVEKFLVG
jgi:trk system potassium uptake protein TrkH